MRLLLVILGAVIAINGAFANSNNELSETDYRRIGKELLTQLKSLEKGAQEIYEGTKKAINLKLKQNPEVKKVEDQYSEGLKDNSLDVECAVSVDKGYSETLDIITEDILSTTLKNITNSEDYLKSLEQKLKKMQTTLNQNLDQEVKKCVKDSKHCSITGELINDTDEIFKFVDLAKHKVISHAENEFSSDGIQEKVKTYLANVPKCLTEKKQ